MGPARPAKPGRGAGRGGGQTPARDESALCLVWGRAVLELRLLLVPLLAGFIGWVTNMVAVRLLFWPLRPVGLPGMPWKLQGVIPRRQAEIARNVGEVVENLLLRPQELVASLNGASYQQEAELALSHYVAERIERGIGRFLPAGLRAAVTDYARETARREAADAVRMLVSRLQERLSGELNVGPIVARRVAKLDPADFEALLLRVIGRELRWLEVLGGVMGFLIGLVQLAVIGWTD